MRLGLRVQILLALGLVLVAAVALLGLLAAPVLRALLVKERVRAGGATLAAIETLAAQLGPPGLARALSPRSLGELNMERAVLLDASGAVLHDTSGEIPLGGAWPVPLVPGVEVVASAEGRPAYLVMYSSSAGVVLHQSLVDVDVAVASGSALILLYTSVAAGLLLLVGFVILTWRVVRPIGALAGAFSRARAGVLRPVEITGGDELGLLAEAFNRMVVELNSKRVELERRIGELTRATAQLEDARDEAIRREKLAVVGQLAAGVAHEVGNPLQAVLGYAEILMSDTDPDQRRAGLERMPRQERLDILRRVHREIERIQKIVGDLVGYSRQEAPAEREPVDLREIVHGAMKLLAPQPRFRGVRVETELPEEPVIAEANPGGLTQVAVNLLLNAADAVQGSGTVTIGAASGDAGTIGEARLWVRDDGPGVQEDLLPRIFDPFFTTKEPGSGTGLGLATSHRIVESLGGRIEVTNPPEGGAQFVVFLPTCDSAVD